MRVNYEKDTFQVSELDATDLAAVAFELAPTVPGDTSLPESLEGLGAFLLNALRRRVPPGSTIRQYLEDKEALANSYERLSNPRKADLISVPIDPPSAQALSMVVNKLAEDTEYTGDAFARSTQPDRKDEVDGIICKGLADYYRNMAAELIAYARVN